MQNTAFFIGNQTNIYTRYYQIANVILAPILFFPYNHDTSIDIEGEIGRADFEKIFRYPLPCFSTRKNLWQQKRSRHLSKSI